MGENHRENGVDHRIIFLKTPENSSGVFCLPLLMEQIQLIGVAIFWSAIGTLFYKTMVYRKQSEDGEKFFPWLKKQGFDMIRAILFSVVFMQLGDKAHDIMESSMGIEFPEWVDKAMHESYDLSHSQLHLALAIVYNFWSSKRG